MTQKYIAVLIAALIATGCVGKDSFTASNGSTSTSGTTTSTTGTVTNANSCAELSAYTSLALCKSTTYAQCYPSTKIIQGATAVCYFPVTGWESCPSSPAAWSYGSYGAWCSEGSGIFLRSRTATCQRTVAACDCVSDSMTQERCTTVSGTPYANCSFTGSGLSSCSATPTPVPTATPTTTPSWCSGVFLNYNVGGNNSETILRNANSSRYSTIISTFAGKGYGVNKIRGTSYTLSALGPLLDADRAASYVVQIEANSSSCWIGNKINMTIRLLRAGVELTSGSETTSCVSFGDEIGRAVDRSLSRMGIPQCQ